MLRRRLRHHAGVNVGSIYGLILTAWGFASAFGPLLIAHMRQSTGTYSSGLHVIAVVMALSAVLPLLVRPPALQANLPLREREAERTASGINRRG